jgi:calcium-dependent protein kinase
LDIGLPFAESEQGIFEQVLKGDLDFSSDPWPSISECAKDLVRKMLNRDPTKRLTAHEALCKYIGFLRHKYHL